MAKTDWKVGDEVACFDSRSRWSIHKIQAITPSGLLKLGDGTMLYSPSLRVRGAETWSRWSYHEVTDEIRNEVRRQWLVRQLSHAAWHNLPTETLDAVYATLKRCAADAAAAGG